MQHPIDPTDHQLVRLICDGDSLAVTLLLQQHGGRVQGYLRQRFPSFDDQEVHDILVDAVLRLLDTFDPQRGAPAAWLLFLAHRAAVDLLRTGHADHEGEWPAGDYEFEGNEPTPLEQLVYREQLAEVGQVLRTLSRLERAVIEADLDVGGTASADYLAKKHATTEGSIYAARRRARRKLQEKLSRLWANLPIKETDHGTEP